MNLREKAREYDSATDDLNFPSTNGEEGHQDLGPDNYANDPLVFADDVIDDDGTSLGVPGLSAHNRTKWVNSGMPVQCHECKRYSFILVL